MQLTNLLRRQPSRAEGSLSSTDLRFIQRIREGAQRLQSLTTHELQSRAEDLRANSLVQSTPKADRNETHRYETLCDAFALTVEGIRRSLGWEIYDVQLLAARSLARNEVAEMQTGEGKTLACTPAAIFLALSGRGVHVATPNAYLAERDTDQLRPIYELLGFSVEHLPEQGGGRDAKRRAYQADITYGSGYEFGFDFLKDQLGRRAEKTKGPARPLGEATL
jgi:preprotein translocase subunit SecA